MEWLDSVMADPELARAVEERLAEMRAEQARLAAREGRALPARSRLEFRIDPALHDEGRVRQGPRPKRREQPPFVVTTPYPDPSVTARRLGMKAEEIARVEELVAASLKRAATSESGARKMPRKKR